MDKSGGVIIKRKAELLPGLWPGGSTTELFIYPEGAQYAKRDFELRVSSATVELYMTNFTVLDGYTRLIMPICGGMTLVHEMQDSVTLAPFDVHTFDGGIKTVCFARCSDFNLMYRAPWRGSISALDEGAGLCGEGFFGLYSLRDDVRVSIAFECGGTELITLMQGDFMHVYKALEYEIAKTDGPAAVCFKAER